MGVVVGRRRDLGGAGRRGRHRRRRPRRLRPASSTCTCTCASPARSTRRRSPRAPRGGGRRLHRRVRHAEHGPAVDDPAAVGYVRAAGLRAGAARVYPCGAVSVGQKGERLTEIGEMIDAGAVAITDDGRPVADGRPHAARARVRAHLRHPVASHCEDVTLSRGGSMNEGLISTRLGLTGIPNAAEDVMHRPRPAAGRADRRPAAHPARQHARRRRHDPRREGARRRRHRRGDAAPLHAHRRGRRSRRTAPTPR
jgi:hypothetical protein